MLEAIVFWSEVVVAVVASIVVVTHRNPVYSVMCLVLTLFSLATIFVMLAGHLIGVLLVLVYAGAIDDAPNTKDLGEMNYVKKALGECAEGKEIKDAQTKPYGCSVKYAS